MPKWSELASSAAKPVMVSSSAAEADPTPTDPPPPPSDAGPPLRTLLPPPPPSVVLTLDELTAMTKKQNLGGKAACQWQRTLRDECIAAEKTLVDITHNTDYNWRALLRSAAPGFAKEVVGAGVVRVSFRLLENQRDSNYSNIDGHGRHVFEILRADSSAIRLHYHKSGRVDDPEYVPAGTVALPGAPQLTTIDGDAPQPAGASSGAAQPAAAPDPVQRMIFTREHLRDTAASRDKIGRAQASAALQTLIHKYDRNGGSGAVDITDGSGFDWLRWLAQIEGAYDIMRDGVHRVYATRWNENDKPLEAVFCYGDGTFTRVPPGQTHYTPGRHHERFVHSATEDWRTMPIFANARVADESWLPMRSNLWS